MREEFLKKFNEANEIAIKRYREGDEKNKEYIDLCMDLVLYFVGVYDYRIGIFYYDSSKIIKDFEKIIGHPNIISAGIIDHDAEIHFDYKRDDKDNLIGYPISMKRETFDIHRVNYILNENGISLSINLDNNENKIGQSKDEILIKFDATILKETQKTLDDETKKLLLMHIEDKKTNK